MTTGWGLSQGYCGCRPPEELPLDEAPDELPDALPPDDPPLDEPPPDDPPLDDPPLDEEPDPVGSRVWPPHPTAGNAPNVARKEAHHR